jgi:hypothetical protein
MRAGSRDVPWLASPPVPAWRALGAPVVLGVCALRLEGRELACSRSGEARKGLEEALGDGLPARTAEVVAAVLRVPDGARPSDALLLDLARTGEVGERVALDLLGVAVPRELTPVSGERLVAAGGVAEWVARGAARRSPGEMAFAVGKRLCRSQVRLSPWWRATSTGGTRGPSVDGTSFPDSPAS